MFWDYFIEQCDKHHKKPSQVATENAIPLGSITAWKKGTEPNTKALRVIADYFDVSTDYLLGRSGADPELPADERELLQNYRRADDRGKRAIRRIAEDEAAGSGAETGGKCVILTFRPRM